MLSDVGIALTRPASRSGVTAITHRRRSTVDPRAAGTGKTTVLKDRFGWLVEHGSPGRSARGARALSGPGRRDPRAARELAGARLRGARRLHAGGARRARARRSGDAGRRCARRDVGAGRAVRDVARADRRAVAPHHDFGGSANSLLGGVHPQDRPAEGAADRSRGVRGVGGRALGDEDPEAEARWSASSRRCTARTSGCSPRPGPRCRRPASARRSGWSASARCSLAVRARAARRRPGARPGAGAPGPRARQDRLTAAGDGARLARLPSCGGTPAAAFRAPDDGDRLERTSGAAGPRVAEAARASSGSSSRRRGECRRGRVLAMRERSCAGAVGGRRDRAADRPGGGAPGEVIVLVPRSRSEGQAVAVALEERAMPHRVVGEAAFFQRAEIRDLLAWLRLLADASTRPQSCARWRGRRSSCGRWTSPAARRSPGGASSTWSRRSPQRPSRRRCHPRPASGSWCS